MKVKVLFGIYLFNSTCCFSDELSNQIQLIQNNYEVVLNIQLDTQENYTQIEIYRTNDTNLGFDNIATIYNLESNSKNIQFVDKTPVPNSINYYKINHLNNTTSSINSIYYIAFNQAGFSIYNEENYSTIFINHAPEDANLHFYLFDMSGRNLAEVNEIIDSKVSFETNLLHHGFYFFQIYFSNNDKFLQGKIFIP